MLYRGREGQKVTEVTAVTAVSNKYHATFPIRGCGFLPPPASPRPPARTRANDPRAARTPPARRGRWSEPVPRAFARSLSGVAKHEHGDFLFSKQLIQLFRRHCIEVPVRNPSAIDRTARVVHQGIADGKLSALPIIRHCHPAKIRNLALFYCEVLPLCRDGVKDSLRGCIDAFVRFEVGQ